MFNTNLKRYIFLSNLCSLFIVSTCFLMGVHFVTDSLIVMLLFFISFLILIIITIFTDRYFKKCYQLKKNAKKVIIKKN